MAMTNTNLIIAVAKLDGVKTYGRYSIPTDTTVPRDRMSGMPLYLTSRDAIIPVIEKWVKEKNIYGVEVQSKEKIGKFISCLYDEFISSDGIDLTDVYGDKHNLISFVLLTATPKQLSIALVKATGNWTEGE